MSVENLHARRPSVLVLPRARPALHRGRPSAPLSFGITGGFEAGERFHNALELFTRLINIGETKSLAAHPASTTHRQLSQEELAAAGLAPDMIRVCVGIEHIDDLIADLDQALASSPA